MANQMTTTETTTAPKIITNNQLEKLIDSEIFTLRKDWTEEKDGQDFFYVIVMNTVTYEESTYQIIY